MVCLQNIANTRVPEEVLGLFSQPVFVFWLPWVLASFPDQVLAPARSQPTTENAET